jgi:hypothetical protein
MQKTQPPPEQQPDVDDTQTVIASTHVLIRDKQSGTILVNKRGS